MRAQMNIGSSIPITYVTIEPEEHTFSFSTCQLKESNVFLRSLGSVTAINQRTVFARTRLLQVGNYSLCIDALQEHLSGHGVCFACI